MNNAILTFRLFVGTYGPSFTTRPGVLIKVIRSIPDRVFFDEAGMFVSDAEAEFMAYEFVNWWSYGIHQGKPEWVPDNIPAGGGRLPST